MPRLPSPNHARQPPFPPFTVLTDRADGTLWVLSHDVTGEYVAINDQGLLINPVVSSTIMFPDFTVYPAYQGPIIPDEPSNPYGQAAKQKRLLVRNGYLGYEDIEPEVEQGRVMTRRRMSRILRRIIVPGSWRSFDSGAPSRDDDTLGYRFEDLP